MKLSVLTAFSLLILSSLVHAAPCPQDLDFSTATARNDVTEQEAMVQASQGGAIAVMACSVENSRAVISQWQPPDGNTIHQKIEILFHLN